MGSRGGAAGRGSGQGAAGPRARGRPDPAAREPVDPDVDLHVPQQREEAAGRRRWPLLTAVACGGALGALARHATTLALPSAPDGFPWGVLAVNAAGCVLIGVVMVLLNDLPPGGGRVRAAARHPLTRPFVGVGVLGGFTTFSTYALGVVRLLEEGRTGTALAFLSATPAAALTAVGLAAWAARAVVRRLPGGPRSAAGERP